MVRLRSRGWVLEAHLWSRTAASRVTDGAGSVAIRAQWALEVMGVAHAHANEQPFTPLWSTEAHFFALVPPAPPAALPFPSGGGAAAVLTEKVAEKGGSSSSFVADFAADGSWPVDLTSMSFAKTMGESSVAPSSLTCVKKGLLSP